MGTTKTYLHKTLEAINPPIYNGVFGANNIPNHILAKANFIIIVNIDDINNPGRHWIVIKTINKRKTYYDPLLLPITSYSKSLQHLLLSLNFKPYNKEPIQSTLSSLCGFFCMHHVLLCNLKYLNVPYKLMQYHKTSLIVNDKVCLTNIEKMVQYLNKTKI